MAAPAGALTSRGQANRGVGRHRHHARKASFGVPAIRPPTDDAQMASKVNINGVWYDCLLCDIRY
jgi:hypothetical protein